MISHKVCVLILSFNGKHLLNECINSYKNNSYKNIDIVVIDNGSNDGTKEWVEENHLNVKVLRSEKNLGYSGGLNFGMQYAFEENNCDYVLITNNDVKADENMILELVRVADLDEKIGFAIGKVFYYDKPNVLQTVGKKFDEVIWNGGHIGNREKDEGQYDNICERYWCDDIYWLVKREVWKKTGGYDTEFAFQGEDFDWQVRAKKIDYKIMYTPYAKLWHKESMTIGKASAFKVYYDSRNPLIIHLKYRSAEEFKKFFRIRVVSQLHGLSKAIIKLKWGIVFATINGISSALFWGIKNKKLTIKHIF